MALEPNMLRELDGTRFTYALRGKRYNVGLSLEDYSLAAEGWRVKSAEAFGVGDNGVGLTIYPHNREKMTLTIRQEDAGEIAIDVEMGRWDSTGYNWMVDTPGHYLFEVTGLEQGALHRVFIDGKISNMVAGSDGVIKFRHVCRNKTVFALECRPPQLN